MKLILLGPPGSGKGTISERLEKDYKLYHLSAGALLREEVAKSTTIGKDIQAYIDRGELVPPEFVVQLVKLAVKNKTNYILDGFPRSIEQANHIKDLNIDAVILLDITESIVIKRFAGRRVCEQGSHGYHLETLPSKIPGLCDVDGTKLIQRKDDTPQIIQKRFHIYNQETAPLIDYYEKKHLLHTIPAAGFPEEVYQNVKKVIEQLKKK